MLPHTTWLICTNKYDEVLVRAINSCLDQSISGFEVLVVCNGIDHEPIASALKKEFGDVPSIIILQTPISYLSFSLNFGIHHARGHYIARMDSDDIAYHDRLKCQVEFMDANPNVVVCGTDYFLINDEDAIISEIIMPKTNRAIRRKLILSNPFCHSSIIIRRDALLLVGGYPGTTYAQDYDLWTRLSANSSFQFANLSIKGSGYRNKSLGEARHSKQAYANMAASQCRNFIEGFGWYWGFASFFTVLKSIILSK